MLPGGLIFKGDSILLVRYHDANGGTYLAAPGGGMKTQESIFQAVAREVMEETGLVVRSCKVILIEDLICSQYKMCKIWTLCDFVSGDVQETEGAVAESIIEAGWFTRDSLAEEVVYPSILMRHDWIAFASDEWQVECLPPRKANF